MTAVNPPPATAGATALTAMLTEAPWPDLSQSESLLLLAIAARADVGRGLTVGEAARVLGRAELTTRAAIGALVRAGMAERDSTGVRLARRLVPPPTAATAELTAARAEIARLRGLHETHCSGLTHCPDGFGVYHCGGYVGHPGDCAPYWTAQQGWRQPPTPATDEAP